MRKPQPEIVSHALELLAAAGELRARAMFGGWGLYADELFFALIAEETLYLKADAESEGDFRAAGAQAFRYTYPDGRTMTMNYWSAPEEALDNPAAMAPWARRALAAALRARTAKKGRGQR